MTPPKGERGEERDEKRDASRLPEMTREMTNRAEPTSQASSEAGKLDDEATARDDDGTQAMRRQSGEDIDERSRRRRPPR